MPEAWQSGSGPRNQIAKVRVGALAAGQFGRVAARQLTLLGIGKATIARWVSAGYLHRVLPGVYAVGHIAPSAEADLAAALLYAGPGAMLSHATALWWYGLLERRPPGIQLSTPRRCRSLHGITVHGRRELQRIWRAGLPVVPLAQALLDFAAETPLERLRKALADTEYRRLLNLKEIDAAAGRGRPGSAPLRRAIEVHQPRLALTRSRLERAFLALCERYEIPLPEINVRVEGFIVDALWREQRLVVELDGYGNHATPAQLRRDRRRDLRLRAAGFTVVRYSEDQINNEPALVAADVMRLLGIG